jgi:hypothetical protein
MKRDETTPHGVDFTARGFSRKPALVVVSMSIASVSRGEIEGVVSFRLGRSYSILFIADTEYTGMLL